MKRPRPMVAGLICLPALCVFILWGARYVPACDLVCIFFRLTLRRPIQTRRIALPPSPDGAWRLEGVVRQWTYHDAQDMSSYEIVARRHGQPFQGGDNLARRNWARALLASSRPEWLANAVLAFHAPDQPRQTTVTLTVINDTGRTLPYVSILMWSDRASSYHLIFELAPQARLAFTGQVPAGPRVTWIVGREALSCDKPAPPPDPAKPLRGITLRISDRSPDIIFE